jgi:hypothetical protein
MTYELANQLDTAGFPKEAYKIGDVFFPHYSDHSFTAELTSEVLAN